jgi:hypothetical protein
VLHVYAKDALLALYSPPSAPTGGSDLNLSPN